ncbi:gag/pol polyprotein [Tanacetum coccineum]|uniref:Gag/pol polyprotein n=1 Tax=Tanacetum coccineum TaxID=301880 RepID=A0ABQ5CA17_9ASTR
MHVPTENLWSAIKRILRYLHGTVEHGMLVRRSSGPTLQAFTGVLWKGNPDTSLEAFSDANRAGNSDDRRSTGGFAIYLGSNLISLTARKQRTVSRSSTEAEYKALTDTVAELTWLQDLLHALGIRSTSTPILRCDNLGATYLSANPIFRARTKHIEIDYHFVREKVAQGDLQIQHISTHDQIEDIFTKPLPTPRFLFLRSKLQVVARP